MTEHGTPDGTPAVDDPSAPVTAPTGGPPPERRDPRDAKPAEVDTPGSSRSAATPDTARSDAAHTESAHPDPAADEPTPADPAGPAPSAQPARSAEHPPSAEHAPSAGSGRPAESGAGEGGPVAPWRRLSSAGALIWVLIALFGFTLVVQLRSNDTDQGLSTMRQDDLVRILSDLDARETRLNSEIGSLEQSQRDLTSGVEGRQAALEEADRRANELGLLAGTLPGRGPGLVIQLRPGGEPIKASAVLNTVQELRGAGGEAMQIAGGDGTAVRVVASSAFVDDGGQVAVDGVRLSAPYVITVIGAPQTMETALNIPGGVVASVGNVGGTVIAEQRKAVDVTAVRDPGNLQYARPVS